MEIKEDYSDYHFAIFSKPADEPILALACSVMNCMLIDRLHEICFMPVVESKSIEYSAKDKRIHYIEAGVPYHASILHFSNHNTEKAYYKSERDKIDWKYSTGKQVPLKIKIKYIRYWWNDYFGTIGRAKGTIYEYSPTAIKKIWRMLKENLRNGSASKK